MTDIVTMPDALYAFAELRFNLTTVSAVAAASAFNPTTIMSGPSVELWELALTMAPQTADNFDELERFLSALRGGKVLARIYDKRRTAFGGRTQPRGAGGATSTINVKTAADQGAESITLKNLLPSEDVALKAMDQLGIGENLYRVQDSSSSDANGWSTVSIRPALRMAVAEGDPVSLVKPTGLFRLTGGDRDFGVGQSLISRPLGLTFIEEPMFSS